MPTRAHLKDPPQGRSPVHRCCFERLRAAPQVEDCSAGPRLAAAPAHPCRERSRAARKAVNPWETFACLKKCQDVSGRQLLVGNAPTGTPLALMSAP